MQNRMELRNLETKLSWKLEVINMKNKILILTQGLLLAILLTACTDDTWNKHYQADPALVSDKNLWTTIESTAELGTFAGILKMYGYDKMLSQSQAYTIFAPNNDALAALDTSNMDVPIELIENHVTRYIIPASGYEPVFIRMLNKKRIVFAYQGDSYFFGLAPFASPTKSIVASNGIIHVLDNYETFFPNIWEFLAQRTDLDSIKNYLYSFNEIIFDEEASIPGSVINGKLTYLDSVFINSNTLLTRLGSINLEDSSYTMLVPNNTAWTEAYNRIKNDFIYYNAKAPVADSLQRANTCFALMQDLIFSNTIQTSPLDSMVSTSDNTFYYPQYLFNGAEKITTSNGSVYITGELKYKAYESWHRKIIVEAERTLGRENTLSTVSIRLAEDLISVSNGMYLQVSPTSTSGNPTVMFEIPNTLSSTYNIYCVFVPGTVNNPDAVGLKPCKVYFNLNYANSSGTITQQRFPASGAIETNPYIMDTVLVASDFKFPTANYGEEIVTVTLKVFSNVLRSETTSYSRELLLDCILLEPKKP
jgi:uncharacterized surface protein with fasciclin (FAS1) repeats